MSSTKSTRPSASRKHSPKLRRPRRTAAQLEAARESYPPDMGAAMMSNGHTPARKPAPSFEAKIAGLAIETAVADWDGDGGCAINSSAWDRVREIAVQARQRVSSIPDPHPSAGGDGAQHLRWARGDRLFDIEFAADGRAYWTQSIGKEVTSGGTGSHAELLEKLEATFT